MRDHPEPIGATVFFNAGNIVPKIIFIKDRPVTIRKVVFFSRHRLGQTEIITFSLASDTAVYEVDFNKASCQWTLKNIFLDG